MMIRYGMKTPENHLVPVLTFLPLLIAVRLVFPYLFSLYDFKRRISTADHLFGAFGAAVCAVSSTILCLVFIRIYIIPQTEFSRIVAFVDTVILTGWFIASRVAVLGRLERAGYRVRTVLLGKAEACDALATEIKLHAPSMLQVVNIISPDALTEGLTVDTRRTLETALEDADQLIVVQSDLPQKALHDLLTSMDSSHAQMYLYPDLDTSLVGKTDLTNIAGIPLITMGSPMEHSPYRAVKRGIDIAIALTVLLVTLPVTCMTALLIRVTSRGPAIFTQERVGHNGDAFQLHKFRTMVVDAEEESGPVLATENDPRVTPLGSILRKTRIDELPQMWNIIRGDMSLVGPRPERAIFSDRFGEENPLYLRRTLVRPGVTGLAQIHGRYDTEFSDKLRYDLVYINSISFATDLRILLATLRVVVTGQGAR